MKSKCIKAVAIFVLMISILFFLWNSLMIILAGFTREYNTIMIYDNNREKIVSLIEENLDCYKEIPDISIAKKIEHTALMHKDEITIYYEDEKNYNFFIDNAYNNPFFHTFKMKAIIIILKVRNLLWI